MNHTADRQDPPQEARKAPLGRQSKAQIEDTTLRIVGAKAALDVAAFQSYID